MLIQAPDTITMTDLLGESRFRLWKELCGRIEEKYDMDRIWNTAGKNWTYEYKYRRGGKTLCGLYAREACMGFMVILGKAEREKFEAERTAYSAAVQAVYDQSQTYRDGKWLMLEIEDDTLFPDVDRLLLLKRRPNRKKG